MVPLDVRSLTALPPPLTTEFCFSGPPGISFSGLPGKRLFNAVTGAFRGKSEKMLLAPIAGLSTTALKLALIAFGTDMVMFPKAASAVT